MKALSYIVICILGLTACKPSYLTKEELTQYLIEEDNGLIQTIERGDLSFSVVYRPNDLIALQEVDNPKDTVEVNQVIKQYEDYLYFILQMSNQGKELLGSNQQYAVADYISTISFGMKPYTRLTNVQQDTVEVVDYIYSRTFGYSSSTDLMFVFDKEEALATEKFYFNLDEFGLGTGNMRFEFETKNIKNTPRLIELKADNTL